MAEKINDYGKEGVPETALPYDKAWAVGHTAKVAIDTYAGVKEEISEIAANLPAFRNHCVDYDGRFLTSEESRQVAELSKEARRLNKGAGGTLAQAAQARIDYARSSVASVEQRAEKNYDEAQAVLGVVGVNKKTD